MPSTAAAVTAASEPSSRNGQAAVAQAVLSHASILARAGRLDAAAKVLLELNADGDDVRVLDLLAKIRAQQGQYGDAEALWTRAKALSEGDEYDAALKRVRALRTRPAWVRAARLIAGIAVTVALATILIRAEWTAPTPAPGAEVKVMPDVTPLEQRHGSTPEESGSVPAQMLGDFSAVGVHQVARDGGVELTFAEGLFLSGVSLRPDAVAIINALGSRLGRVPRGTVVIITGHTDDVPVAVGNTYADNAALGLARATVVMSRLAATSSLRTASFLIGTAGDGGTPYPNDGRENRLRNRTVTIEVRQDARGQ
jgi:flagellar motor protein MotB